MSKKLVVLCIALCGVMVVPAGALADVDLDLASPPASPVAPPTGPVIEAPTPVAPLPAADVPAVQGPAETMFREVRGLYPLREDLDLRALEVLRRRALIVERVVTPGSAGKGIGDLLSQPELAVPVAVQTAEQLLGHEKQEGALPTYDE